LLGDNQAKSIIIH